MRTAPALPLAVALLLAPLALAQHDHGTGQAVMVIAHDSAPDGREFVGNVAHFEAVLFGADGAPQFHHNMRIEVRENGVLLWSTTPDSGHDYDGVNGFDVVFPVPGAYTVTATAGGRDGEVTGSFAGYVVPADAAGPAKLDLQLPAQASAGQPVDIGYAITRDGAPVAHGDAVFEVRKGSAVEFRVHTHGHAGPQALRYAFPDAGTHTVRVLAYDAYPAPDRAAFPAFEVSREVQVSPAPPGLPAGAPRVEAPDAKMNDVTMGTSSGRFVVMTTYDPYTSIGPFGQVRLSTLVVDPATMQPVQHVNFQAALTDALGREVFRSASLHEYDGIFELLAGAQTPGQYRLDVQASQGAWRGNASVAYTVLPPAEALSAGPQVVDVQGLEHARSGVPTPVTLFAHDLAGTPFAHSEVDLQVVPKAGGAPIVATKLHAHDDGKFAFNLTFPAAGDYVLRLAPFPLEARPTPVFLGPGLGPLDVPVAVASGAALPVGTGQQPLAPASLPAERTPGPGAALGLLALAVVALLARRR